MNNILQVIMKRPKDKTILIGRIIFGLLFIAITYYNFIFLNKGLEINFIPSEKIMITKYIIVAFGLIPLIMGLTNICLLKSKYMRIIQVIFWILLIYISASIPESPKLDFDILIFLMGLFPIIAGITGKCITEKCRRYGQKITKVRV